MLPIFVMLNSLDSRRTVRVNMNYVDSYVEKVSGGRNGDEKGTGSTITIAGIENGKIDVLESPDEIDSLVAAAITKAGFDFIGGDLLEMIRKASRGEA